MKILLKTIISILIIIALYIILYRSYVYIRPEHWEFETKNNEIKITVSNSYSLTNWTHSYEKKGNFLYVKIYNVSYFNPFVNYRGYTYNFCIPEKWSEIQKIYAYDLNENMVLVKDNERIKMKREKNF